MKSEIVVGIDIGGTNTVFAIIDRDGNILAQETISTSASDYLDDFITQLTDRINILLLNLNLQPETVLGIGIGAPNGNFYKGTIENAVNLKWKGIIPFAQLVRNKFNYISSKATHIRPLDIPVFITNDANAAAIGEMVYGAAKGMKDFIVITLGTGLGSGFVVNGKLVYGYTGLAGELGHVIIEPNGRECNCGRKGCLETYVSATGITRTAIELLQNSKEKSILRNSNSQNLNSKIIYEAAIKNDIIALKAFDFTSEMLGISLANIVTITNPQAIFLTGGLAKAGDLIIKSTEMYMNKNMLINFKDTVILKPSAIHTTSTGVYGAAALAWHELNNLRIQ